MTAPSHAPERIDFRRSDDPRDVVHRAVAALAQGGTLALASLHHVVLVAGALHPAALQALGHLDVVTPDALPPTLWLRGPDEVADWIPDVSPLAAKLARRAWPGPVTLIFPAPADRGLLPRLSSPARELLVSPLGVALGIPEVPFLRDVLRLLPGPVVARTLSWGEGDAAEGLNRLAQQAPCGLVIDGLSDELTEATTVARISADGWELVRTGAIDEASLARMAGTIVLFICTGNTCRSPMAEALCKLLIAERLGCDVADLPSRGYVVTSAGIAAIADMPAAANAVDVIRERGGSLAEHASRKLTAELVRQADLILAMTGDHLEALTDHMPEAAPRTRLLHPEGLDVPDPVGANRETYKETADAIEGYLRELLDELVEPRS